MVTVLGTPPTKQNQDKKVPKTEVKKKVKGERNEVKGKSAVEDRSPK